MNEFTRSETLKEYLDDARQNAIIIRVRTNPTFSAIESFAITFVHFGESETNVIFKVDGSQKERINLHYYFKKPVQKVYHNRMLSFETVEHYLAHIRANWQWYLAQYKENYI